MTETLTDEERVEFLQTRTCAGAKALRIIDAHAADRAALVAQLEAARELLIDAEGWFASPQHRIAHGAVMCMNRIRGYLAKKATASCQETGVHRDCDCEDPREVGYGVTSQDQVDSVARKIIDWAKEQRQSDPTHAALVAQLAELTRERDAALTQCASLKLQLEAARGVAEAEVTRLTRERDAARMQRNQATALWSETEDAAGMSASELCASYDAARADNARLTEALAAAERSAGRADSERAAYLERVGTLQKNEAFQRDKRLAAEARVRELAERANAALRCAECDEWSHEMRVEQMKGVLRAP